jgi:hypothetical protein
MPSDEPIYTRNIKLEKNLLRFSEEIKRSRFL